MGRIRPHRRRIAFTLGTLLALVLGAIALLLVEAQIARSRTYVADPDFEIDTTIPGAEPAIEMAVLGDSTVAGLGVETVEDTLAVQIAGQVAKRTGRAVHVVGHGVSGARTRAVLREQLEQVVGAEVIVVEVGSNDVTHGTRMGELRRDTHTLLEAAAERADVVVLGSSGRLDTKNFLRPLRDLITWRASAVRRIQGEVVSELDADRFGFVDIGADVDREYDRTKGANSSDGFHPAAPGYGVWARALGREVAERIPHANRSAET